MVLDVSSFALDVRERFHRRNLPKYDSMLIIVEYDTRGVGLLSYRWIERERESVEVDTKRTEGSTD